jgi:putative serine protease PepD
MNKTIIHLALAVFVFLFLPECRVRAGDWSADTVGKVQRATVTVYAFDKAGKHFNQGSGFFFEESGHLITNYHVLGRAASARVKAFDGREFTVKSIVAEDRRDDIVEAEVDLSGGPTPYLMRAEVSPRVGEPVMVVGSPLGMAGVTSEGKVLQVGEVEGLGECFAHDAGASHGSSGSPVVNPGGEVIGMETAGLTDRPGVNFAIPVKRFSGLTSSYRELETVKAPVAR